MQGVVALQVPGVAIGKEFISPRHLADRPVESARRLFGVGDHGLLQVGNAIVDVKFHHFGVDHDELDFVGLGLIEQTDDERVDAYALARAGGAGNEHMGHFGKVRHHVAANNVPSQGKGDL